MVTCHQNTHWEESGLRFVHNHFSSHKQRSVRIGIKPFCSTRGVCVRHVVDGRCQADTRVKLLSHLPYIHFIHLTFTLRKRPFQKPSQPVMQKHKKHRHMCRLKHACYILRRSHTQTNKWAIILESPIRQYMGVWVLLEESDTHLIGWPDRAKSVKVRGNV